MTVVYRSNAGTTRTYAEMLAASLGCKAAALSEADLAPDEPVVFLGWVFSGKVQGLREAEKRFDLVAAAAVGMLTEEAEVASVREKAALSVPLFFLPGNFHPENVTGVLKLAMRVVCRSMKTQAEKSGDPALLEQVRQVDAGVDKFDEAALRPLIEYLQK